MDGKKIIDITNDVENKSNNELLNTLSVLSEEFEKTKDLIINLTRHMDGVEDLYDKVNSEIKKRNIK
jgi:uncharacterized membrane protein YgaE (UPF0421/DUF939 family)